jgi:surface protein
MQKITFLFFFISVFGHSQTPITDANFQEAINTCLTTNPEDGLCSDSEYGAMPDWDVSQVTSMTAAFYDKAEFNGDISSWDVRNVTDMSSMFSADNYVFETAFNQDIGGWNVSNVTNMMFMFGRSSSFNQDIGDWNVGNVLDMSYMFLRASSFNQDIGRWNTANVKEMRSMFTSAISFNQDISAWDVGNVTNMMSMFGDVSGPSPVPYTGATSFNQDISAWDVSNVTVMLFMFNEATSFNQNLGAWNVSNVTNMSQMLNFSGLSKDNYDSMLIEWSEQDVQSNVPFGAQGVNYCNGEAARQSLIDNKNWTIEDAGLDCSTTGVGDQNQLNISIYPNPTNDKLFIQGLSSLSKVSIYNVLGKLVLSQTISKEIDVKQLSKGIYILKIADEQKEIVRKFIKN